LAQENWYSAKVLKRLVKLTPSSTFYARFLYKSLARSIFVLEVKVKLFIVAMKMAHLRSKNVGEIDTKSFFD
jgi:hypothetical protein